MDQTSNKTSYCFYLGGGEYNDALLTGPKLQQNIISMLLILRLYKYVHTADIKQMYRQILITDSHTS